MSSHSSGSCVKLKFKTPLMSTRLVLSKCSHCSCFTQALGNRHLSFNLLGRHERQPTAGRKTRKWSPHHKQAKQIRHSCLTFAQENFWALDLKPIRNSRLHDAACNSLHSYKLATDDSLGDLLDALQQAAEPPTFTQGQDGTLQAVSRGPVL